MAELVEALESAMRTGGRLAPARAATAASIVARTRMPCFRMVFGAKPRAMIPWAPNRESPSTVDSQRSAPSLSGPQWYRLEWICTAIPCSGR